MLDRPIADAARRLTGSLISAEKSIVTVESCTGGGIGGAITAQPGSSACYPGGLITYSNELKQSLCGVPACTLEAHGAVSPQTAHAMATGGRERLRSDLAVSVTGIAGPGGGSEGKPVGTVWVCVCAEDDAFDCRRFFFSGDRDAIRRATVLAALEMSLQVLNPECAVLEHEAEQWGG